MKLLRIIAEGLPLFKNRLSLTFYAQQRVNENDRSSLFPLYPDSKYYLNCSNALIGINASGKTSVLKVILLVLDILNNEPISHSETRDILGETEEAVFIINFLSDNGDLGQLEIHIKVANKQNEKSFCITKETLWIKPLSTALTKKKLVDFTDIIPYEERTNKESYLPDDVSIIIAYNKKHSLHTSVINLLAFTDLNILPISNNFPSEVIQFLDPTVEAISFENINQNVSIHLKFKQKKEILLSDTLELNNYLSSGTIKGIVTFTWAIHTLKKGGYLIVDEIENHFNKEIAATLMRFFMDSSVNTNGGILIFSTHYPEILDEFERNDCIFITRNREGIQVDNLSDVLNRNDVKKSDAYQSGFLDGTVPAYEAYIELKKAIQRILNKDA